MRKLLYSLVLMVFTYVPSMYAKNVSEHITFATIPEDTNIVMSDVKAVVSYYVPEKYQDALYFYTNYEEDENASMNMLIQILAIGCWESNEWTVTVSPKNKNGSRDYGYLMLNENNINDSWFMEKFGYHEYDGFDLVDETDVLELYLICCINLYKALYKRYGDDAAYCYNGGETRYIKNRLPDSTYAYKRKVNGYVDKIIGQIEYERDERIRIAEEKETLLNELTARYMGFKRYINRVSKYSIALLTGRYKIIVISPQSYLCDDRRLKNVIVRPLTINLNYKYEGQVVRYGHRKMSVFRSLETGELVYM